MSLAILVPMLGRPHRVAPLLDSIRAATPEAAVLFLLTPGDTDVIAAVQAAAAEKLLIDYQPCGDYARKINAGIGATDEEHIFTGADDLRFHTGWYAACQRKLTAGIGVVGTVDRCNRRTTVGEHATHMLVTRSYVEQFGTADEPGKFFCELYPHEFVDDEAVATAKARRAYAHARDAIVEHLHPMVRKAPMDAMYAAQAERMRIGRPIFLERRHLWT